MRGPGQPMFIARETYRRRRLMDAARFLPYLGTFLFFAPMLWARDTGTAAGAVYLFAAWALLIALSLAISRRLGSETIRDGEDGGDD